MGLSRKIRLHRVKHKLTAVTREGVRIKIRYRRYRDAKGKWRHELIGPFDLTEGKDNP